MSFNVLRYFFKSFIIINHANDFGTILYQIILKIESLFKNISIRNQINIFYINFMIRHFFNQ